MKVLMPPLRDITWPRNRSWISTYLSRGLDKLIPREQVAIATQLKTSQPAVEQINEYVIFTLAHMGFTLSAIREFFSRPEVKVKLDANTLYAKAVAQQHAFGHAHLLDDGEFYQFLRVVRLYLGTPAGELELRSKRKIFRISMERREMDINVNRAYPVLAAEAARRIITLPLLRDVLLHLRRIWREEFITSIATDSAGNYKITLPLDWMLRHDLLPQNSTFYSCVRRIRV
jgi:hypothetical protein